ncbi:hypothetical protein RO3G_12911 [Rhizopus delemar RA 99-880]|uniref:Uncharacterized protein n=1 Tax=Rhizopus delemar (strain RA 99-880 / ATCC MYA-4621 / FGSC 9543 / NRRL 43880) TaxID=246409 RepID=I1CIC0_RHIO9|nr:hypothetical protein RO3G_12911 [Rhizopus delemar RA 99-880]|eukprot:EIE88200.1 hypothetical protein RO3G_12911 [Rhizopus delemar RA 99-880]
MRRILAKEGFQVCLLDEFRTSSLYPSCQNGKVEMFKKVRTLFASSFVMFAVKLTGLYWYFRKTELRWCSFLTDCFKLTEEQCSSLMIDEVFNNLPVIQWSNVTKLIAESIKCYHDTLENTKVFNNIVTSLESIYQKTKNNTTLASLFDKKFASRIIKFQTEELKKSNRTQGHRNATLITSQCNDEYYDELMSCSKSHKTLEEREDSEDQGNGEIDEAEFPSDLTFDHHPQRTTDYFLLHDGSSEEVDKQSDDGDWIIGNFNNPASLSDIKHLISFHRSLNDINIFDENIDESLTKYFGVELHKVNPPDDLKSALKLCTDFLIQATEQDDGVDLHMVHILTQLLPVFVAGSHDSLIEDSYVHRYLAPIFQSIYSMDKKFTVRWANGTLNGDLTSKPGFQVFSRIINIRCIVIVAAFKHKPRNSAVESDFIKLGKQMKLNHFILVKGIGYDPE